MPNTSGDPGPGSLDRTCNSNTRVRVSRSDDTDLDGTTQNLPQFPGSRRTLREFPRELHHVTTFPRTIRRCHAFHDPPSTLQYLLEALGTLGQQAGARGIENRVENLPSGEPITCRILRRQHRLPLTKSQRQGIWPSTSWLRSLATSDVDAKLASTPMPPRATATLNVHILSRQVHAVNIHLPGRQPVNGHPWPPTLTELQQVLFHFRTNPALYLLKPHIHTIHSTQPTHIGLTTAVHRRAPTPPTIAMILGLRVTPHEGGPLHALGDYLQAHHGPSWSVKTARLWSSSHVSSGSARGFRTCLGCQAPKGPKGSLWTPHSLFEQDGVYRANHKPPAQTFCGLSLSSASETGHRAAWPKPEQAPTWRPFAYGLERHAPYG
ncbi:hypothetical protein Taro_007659 [Colocasia esculenta]|uniref:Uncharacterized protein n=1 Tax=Colocasia esculenta TaxID=4460 RepID=A0A843TUS6_COLES|nr:hypothetical protein [Colocasia esculenta]